MAGGSRQEGGGAEGGGDDDGDEGGRSEEIEFLVLAVLARSRCHQFQWEIGFLDLYFCFRVHLDTPCPCLSIQKKK